MYFDLAVFVRVAGHMHHTDTSEAVVGFHEN
jgi:hypothetical protein